MYLITIKEQDQKQEKLKMILVMQNAVFRIQNFKLVIFATLSDSPKWVFKKIHTLASLKKDTTKNTRNLKWSWKCKTLFFEYRILSWSFLLLWVIRQNDFLKRYMYLITIKEQDQKQEKFKMILVMQNAVFRLQNFKLIIFATLGDSPKWLFKKINAFASLKKDRK